MHRIREVGAIPADATHERPARCPTGSEFLQYSSIPREGSVHVTSSQHTPRSRLPVRSPPAGALRSGRSLPAPKTHTSEIPSTPTTHTSTTHLSTTHVPAIPTSTLVPSSDGLRVQAAWTASARPQRLVPRSLSISPARSTVRATSSRIRGGRTSPRTPHSAAPATTARPTAVLHDDFRRALEAIKLRAPIEDVVRERVPALKKAGALWVACCPFHDERTPSFKVDPRRGTWRCFGACGVGGDVIAFVEKSDNVTFRESVEILAARCGVDLPKKSGASRERDEQLDPLRAALEFACKFYRGEFATSEGRASAQYLADRGLSSATAEAFAIGHAPASGQALVSALRAANLPFEAAERAGLVRRTDQGRAYDFFRGRLVIPIRDLHGAVVGFGARRLDDRDESGPKYINTAETELFHKGRLVYALDRALPEVRKRGHVVLVEGYTDVMAAHQCGIGNVVAVLGTATTEDHAALLRRTGSRRISLVFDGDDAGRKAAWRALQGLLHLEIEIDVVSLVGGIDPCDLCLRDGASEGARAFTAELEMARSWFDFVCEGLAGLSGLDLAREVDRVLELFSRLAKPVHREARILELAERVRMSPESLRAQAAGHSGARRPRASIARPADAVAADAGSEDREPVRAPVAVSPTLLREEREMRLAFEEMVGAMLADASLAPIVEPWLEHCPVAELVRIADSVLSLREEDAEVIDENVVLTRLADDPARARVVALAEHVRVADEDWTPTRFVEVQLARVRRIVETRVRREDYARLRDREVDLLGAAGPEAAAQDPDALALARSLSPTRRLPTTHSLSPTRDHAIEGRDAVAETSRVEAGKAP